jgi:hypothetical protein
VIMPRFTAEASLSRTGEHYRSNARWIGHRATDVVTPQAKYCCLFTYPEGYPIQGVSGCRGHDTWRPFAELGCAVEAIVRGDNAQLVSGICSNRALCQGKVLGANAGAGGGTGFGAGPIGSGGGVNGRPVHQL